MFNINSPINPVITGPADTAVRNRLVSLEALARKFADDRKAMTDKVTALNNSGKDYTAEGKKTMLQPQIELVRSHWTATFQPTYDAAIKLLGELEENVLKVNKTATFTDKDLLSILLQDFGSNSSHETIEQVVSTAINQPAKSFLRDIFKARGVTYGDVILEKAIYNIPSQLKKIQDLAYACIMLEGSINTWASEMRKLARWEGINDVFTDSVDPAGENEALLRGAGLLKK